MLIGTIFIILIIVSVVQDAHSAGKIWRIVPLLLSPVTGIIAALLWNADPVEVGYETAEQYRLLGIIGAILLVIQVIVGAYLMSGVTRKTP